MKHPISLLPLLLTAPALWLVACTPAQTIPDDLPVAQVDGVLEPAFADVPDTAGVVVGEKTTDLSSKITKVTVYSDRAMVTRQATTDVSTEAVVYAFRRLPGWVDDGTVRVGVSAGRIVDVRVERDFLAHATDATYVQAEDQLQAMTQKMGALDDELRILDAQKAQIEAIKAFSLEKVTQETTFGTANVTSYGQVVEFISDSLRKTAAARREVLVARTKLTPEVQAAERRLNEVRSLLKLEETTVLVTLVSSQPTPSTLDLSYMLPGVTWEPMHELRVSTTDDKSVEVTSFAVVTQTSGEDWANAELTFSTQSSEEAVRIPELEALTLGDTSTTSRVEMSRVSSFSRAQKAFEGQSQLWNKVHQKSNASIENFEEVFQSNYAELQVTQSKTVELFQSLQTRGTTAHFEANPTRTVRGDGHAVRVRIGKSTLASSQKIVAAPEESLNAARTLQMSNTSGQALLPGKVALFQDGAFLGMTEVGFIAEGESFALFLSVADHLKLSRVLDRKQSGLVRKKRNQMQLAFIVKVENLSDRETSLTLSDRIPVSENKDIKVDNIKIKPLVKADSKGLLSWALTLKPHEVRTFEISYQIEYPPTLVVETRRKGFSPGSPSPARGKDYRIEDQVRDYEEMF